ncbi:MAG: hypothetical protein PF636_04420, partial [Actinomycetota bacterium]|nr:hypothetical protein [Actinomycetota bacterium]
DEASNPSDPAPGDQSDSSGDSDSPMPEGDGSTGTPTDSLVESDLRILWWNDTSSKSPAGAMISIGDSVWAPDPDADSARGLLADVLVDDTLTLVVLPDGESGARIEVPILITSDMDPTSDIDAIHVEVSDSSVRVLGNAVDNFDVTFDRF